MTTYWKGDRAQYTGHSQVFHGGLFYELIMQEGRFVGQTKWTSRGPTGTK